MPRFIRTSSRRLAAATALAVTTAIPALVIIGGQTPASAGIKPNAKTPAVVVPFGNKWR